MLKLVQIKVSPVAKISKGKCHKLAVPQKSVKTTKWDKSPKLTTLNKYLHPTPKFFKSIKIILIKAKSSVAVAKNLPKCSHSSKTPTQANSSSNSPLTP